MIVSTVCCYKGYFTHMRTDSYGAKSVSEICINGPMPAIGNAIKHATGTIRVTFGRCDHQITIAVQDSGPGISPELCERVFDRFFRGDETHDLVMDTPGTGLGLAIVRELVDVHNGEITFESEVGQGTTFNLRLPAQAPAEEPDDAAPVETQVE